MRSNCTKVLPPSVPPPGPTPAAVASRAWFRSVPRSSAWMMVSVVAGVVTALSWAVGRWSDSTTFSSRRTVCDGATPRMWPSSIMRSTRTSPTVRMVSPFCSSSPTLRARLTPAALTANTVPLPLMAATVANWAMMISVKKWGLSLRAQGIHTDGTDHKVPLSGRLLDLSTNLRVLWVQDQ